MYGFIAFLALNGILMVHANEQKSGPAYVNAREGEASLSGFSDIRPIDEIIRQEQQEDTRGKPDLPHSPLNEVNNGSHREKDREKGR